MKKILLCLALFSQALGMMDEQVIEAGVQINGKKYGADQLQQAHRDVDAATLKLAREMAMNDNPHMPGENGFVMIKKQLPTKAPEIRPINDMIARVERDNRFYRDMQHMTVAGIILALKAFFVIYGLIFNNTNTASNQALTNNNASTPFSSIYE